MRGGLGILVGMVVVSGCDPRAPSTTDANDNDDASGSASDAPPVDGTSVDGTPDSGGTSTCESITPWCADGFCLTIPEAPSRGNASAVALASNGALFVAVGQQNTLAHISLATPMEMVTLPAGTEPGYERALVSAMTAVSPTDIYACSPLGPVWHFDGAQWAQLPPGWINGECDVLWAASGSEFWSIGQGYLRRKLNGTWTQYGGGRQVYALDGRNPNDVWFGGARGYIAHWDGAQYEVLADASDNGDVPDIRNVAILAADDIALGDKRLVSGNLMTSAQLGYPAAPELTWGSSNDFWIVTRSNGPTPRALWRYSGSWTKHPVPADFTLAGLAIVGTGPNDVWFVSNHAILHWDGTALESCATWQPTQPSGRLVGIGSTYNELWVHDTSNALWRSTGGGAFLDVHNGIGGVRGFDAHASGVFVASGVDATNPSNGTMPIAEKYTGGTTWTSITCPWTLGEFALLRAVKVVAANDVWFAGDDGHVYHWDGVACSAVAHPLAVTTLRHINATGPSDVWIFGDTATLHWNGSSLLRHPQTIAVIDSVVAGTSLWGVATNDVLEWNGSTWTSKGAGSITNGRRIWATSGSDVWVYGATLLRFNGATWTPQPLPYQAFAGAGAGVGLWGTGTPGDFLISVSGGIVRHP